MVVDVHYFIFVLDADTAVFAAGVFGLAYVALKMIYKMWKSNLQCPRCGESYKNHMALPPPPPSSAQPPPLPNSLWT